MLKLFYAPGTCALASHVALAESGAAYETERLDFKAGDQRKPEYLAVNPKGKVPALLTDRGVLTENPVILGYVAQTYPEAKLAPEDSFAFGDMQAFNMFLAATVHPQFNTQFRPGNWADDEAAQQAVTRKSAQTIKIHFKLIAEQLGEGPWIRGDSYSTSDGYLLVFTRWYDQVKVGDLATDFPTLHHHRTAVQSRPAVQRALEEEGLQAL